MKPFGNFITTILIRKPLTVDSKEEKIFSTLLNSAKASSRSWKAPLLTGVGAIEAGKLGELGRKGDGARARAESVAPLFGLRATKIEMLILQQKTLKLGSSVNYKQQKITTFQWLLTTITT